MPWIATITYASGSGWLSLDPTSGSDGANVRVYAAPGSLAPGTYQATIAIDASPNGGISTVQVTFTVNAATPATPKPTIVSTMNAASFAATPAASGARHALGGSGAAGKTVVGPLVARLATSPFVENADDKLALPIGVHSLRCA